MIHWNNISATTPYTTPPKNTRKELNIIAPKKRKEIFHTQTTQRKRMSTKKHPRCASVFFQVLDKMDDEILDERIFGMRIPIRRPNSAKEETNA